MGLMKSNEIDIHNVFCSVVIFLASHGDLDIRIYVDSGTKSDESLCGAGVMEQSDGA